MIPEDEPVLCADSLWVSASNLVHADDRCQLMSRCGREMSYEIPTKHFRAPQRVYRVTLSDGSWFRTTEGGISIDTGGAPVEFDTLDTNNVFGVALGPRLPVAAIADLGVMPCVAILAPQFDAAGHETYGMIVVRNYAAIRGDR